MHIDKLLNRKIRNCHTLQTFGNVTLLKKNWKLAYIVSRFSKTFSENHTQIHRSFRRCNFRSQLGFERNKFHCVMRDTQVVTATKTRLFSYCKKKKIVVLLFRFGDNYYLITTRIPNTPVYLYVSPANQTKFFDNLLRRSNEL